MDKLNFRISLIGDASPSSENIQIFTDILKDLQTHFGQTLLQPVILSANGQFPEIWSKFIKKNKLPFLSAPTLEEHSADGAPLDAIGRRDLVLMSDLTDLAFGFWDENPDGAENTVWETIHRCTEKRVPCIWVSKKDGNVYWALHSLFTPYRSELLTDFYSGLISQTEDDAPVDSSFRFRSIILCGARHFTSSFLGKKNKGTKIEAKTDPIMEDDCAFLDAQENQVRNKILSAFRIHDSRAIQFGDLFRGVLFWRAVLPVAATASLTIAFYGASFFDSIKTIMEIAAGFAFFIHGGLFFFSHRLAKSKQVQAWQTRFLYNRVVSEVLRFYAHILPFGITLPLERILDRSGFSSTSHASTRIWKLLHDPQLGFANYREDRIPQYLCCMSDYLESQLAYHKRNAERYRSLVNRIEQHEKLWFRLGVLAVGMRGFFQFWLMLVGNWSRQTNLVPMPGIFSSLVVHASKWKAGANMAAMLIPAIASYLSGKQNLCGFKDIYTMDEQMIVQLNQALALVKSLEGREVNYSMVRNITEQIGILVMGDVSSWNEEMKSRKLKGL